jgi:hypothetical protein
MAHHKDKQVLPYLLEHGLEHGVMKDIPPDWKPLLIQLLSELRTQDVNLLQESHRAKLNEYLLREIGYSLAIKMAILKAYQQVGDVSALTTVEKLIEQKKRYSSKSAVALCQAAKECLPYLQQNVGRVTEIQTLLRASSPNEKQEELLRPLQAEKPEEDSLLLRASEKTPN